MLTAARLREVLAYDPASGVFMWLKQLAGRGRVGTIAGAVTMPNGYRVVTIDKKQFRAARLAWFFTHNEWPPEMVDHINGDRADDRIANLRRATRAQNLANAKDKAGSSRLKGVSWDKARKLWRAQIQVDCRNRFIGRYATEEAAHAAYMVRAEELFGEFARAA